MKSPNEVAKELTDEFKSAIKGWNGYTVPYWISVEENINLALKQFARQELIKTQYKIHEVWYKNITLIECDEIFEQRLKELE